MYDGRVTCCPLVSHIECVLHTVLQLEKRWDRRQTIGALVVYYTEYQTRSRNVTEWKCMKKWTEMVRRRTGPEMA